MAAKAHAHVINAFGDWIDAEEAKAFIREGAMLDSHDSN
jgi:hypothetical protein